MIRISQKALQQPSNPKDFSCETEDEASSCFRSCNKAKFFDTDRNVEKKPTEDEIASVCCSSWWTTGWGFVCISALQGWEHHAFLPRRRTPGSSRARRAGRCGEGTGDVHVRAPCGLSRPRPFVSLCDRACAFRLSRQRARVCLCGAHAAVPIGMMHPCACARLSAWPGRCRRCWKSRAGPLVGGAGRWGAGVQNGRGAGL